MNSAHFDWNWTDFNRKSGDLRRFQPKTCQVEPSLSKCPVNSNPNKPRFELWSTKIGWNRRKSLFSGEIRVVTHCFENAFKMRWKCVERILNAFSRTEKKLNAFSTHYCSNALECVECTKVATYVNAIYVKLFDSKNLFFCLKTWFLFIFRAKNLIFGQFSTKRPACWSIFD